MLNYKFKYLTKAEVIDALKNGIESEHFRARLTYPGGYDNRERVTVEMIRPFEISRNDWGENASDLLYKALTEELNRLHYDVEAVNSEIAWYAIDREYKWRRAAQ